MKTNETTTKITARLADSYSCSQENLMYKKWAPDRQGANSPNILFISGADNLIDVDCLINSWATENNINLVEITENNGMLSKHQEMATVDFTTGGSYSTNYIVVSKEKFDLFNTPNTVLYFKRIDDMQDERFRRLMLKFMNNQTVTLGDGKVYFAENILF